MGEYRKLLVWQRARALVRRVQQLVADLPASERAVRGDQLIRAATSIRYNIAEGAGFNSDRQFAKHLRYALASANEVQDELDDLDEQKLLPERDRDLPGEVAEIRAMTFVLLRRVDGRNPQDSRKPARKSQPDPAGADTEIPPVAASASDRPPSC